jgi:hypothetical protein
MTHSKLTDHFAILSLHSPREQLFGIADSISPAGVIFRGFHVNQIDTFKYQFKNHEYTVFFQTCFYPLHRIERIAKDERHGDLPSILEDILETSTLTEDKIRTL